jgi:hypothetical protein
MDNHNIKSITTYRQAQEDKHINAEKYTKKQTKCVIIVMIIIIQFNSILYYLCAEPTATRPITGTGQRRYR